MVTVSMIKELILGKYVVKFIVGGICVLSMEGL